MPNGHDHALTRQSKNLPCQEGFGQCTVTAIDLPRIVSCTHGVLSARKQEPAHCQCGP